MPSHTTSLLLGFSQLHDADTEHKRKAIEATVSADSPLKSFTNPERFTISDDEMLKRLCGLD